MHETVGVSEADAPHAVPVDSLRDSRCSAVEVILTFVPALRMP